ncbi:MULTISPECIES: integrase arm-type DNA-binding domain-containing protein [unclassified Ruegeria]|uniref:tyrosine-type recombinase/integrase n=1 Tax=unclassified Ruegeria TaxID=2625375 RepID=UPI001ADCC26B|nr:MULTISPECIES: integrase arm-type DNA-binding domain-containing protein [unclassified Ruegeria]MBO9410826.1 tyrosine-type recombinase/integrase [Ruegeria sp. R8_1]MBO9415027.1 tyrosine-type recombinase/integrase [Ruegeria sp. R8_2]
MTKLTDKKIKLADGGGLALIVHPKGSKTWVWRYRVNGKQREMTLGSYPSVGLKDARQRVKTQRNLLDTNIAPDVAEMRAEVQARSGLTVTTFAGVARAWLAEERLHWGEKTYVRASNRIEKDAIPLLGTVEVADITAVDIKAVALKIADRGSHETARRVIRILRQVLGYAEAEGLISTVPGANVIDRFKPKPKKHHPAIVEPERLSMFLQALDAWPHPTLGKPLVQIVAHTGQRVGEVRKMRWADINMGVRVWNNVVTKTGITIAIPLTNPVIDILSEMSKLNGHREYVFASDNGPVSAPAAMDMIRKIRFEKETNGHGLRATFRTLVVERLGFDKEHAEAQLSHASKEQHGRAYDRTIFLGKRRVMMEAYSQFLVQLQASRANVVPMIAAAKV